MSRAKTAAPSFWRPRSDGARRNTMLTTMLFTTSSPSAASAIHSDERGVRIPKTSPGLVDWYTPNAIPNQRMRQSARSVRRARSARGVGTPANFMC